MFARRDTSDLSPPENNGYLLQRLSAYIDFHIKGHVRCAAHGVLRSRKKGRPRPVIDASKLFFEPTFANITVAAEKENSLVMRR